MSADIRAMSEQLAADPSSLVFLPLAEQLLARGDLQHASRVARKGAERHPRRADVHDLVARIALAQGDAATAERAWKASLELATDFAPAQRGLAFLCFKLGRLDESAAYVAQAERLQPDDAGLAQLKAALADAQAAEAAESEPAPAPAVPASAASLFDAALAGSSQVALLLDADGLVVAGHYHTAEGDDLGASLGAHLSGVSDEAERAMRHFGLGRWTRIALESEAATVTMAPVGDGVTLVAAPRETPLGFVRRTLEQCAATARRWLEGGS